MSRRGGARGAAQQLVAEAQRLAQCCAGALRPRHRRVRHTCFASPGPERLPKRIETPLAIGPELDLAGLAEASANQLSRYRGVEIVPLWLRGQRDRESCSPLGHPRPRPLAELARQAAAAVTLADRYTDVFARAQRRKHPKAAAEMQQGDAATADLPRSQAARWPETYFRATTWAGTGSTPTK